LAALAATASFAQVTMTGVMDAGYQSGKEYGQDAKTVVQNGSRTTAIKFIGVEDLGGGLKAKFQFEADPAITAANGNNNNVTATSTNVVANPVTANATPQNSNTSSAQSGLVGAGYNYVMLESAQLGSIEFGTINTNTLATQGLGAQKFGTAIGSGYKKIWAELTRYENSWSYKTPTFQGFNASYLSGVGNDSQYGSTTTVTLRRPTVSELGLNYDQGPVSVKLSMLTSTTSSNEAVATTTAGAASNVKTAYNTLAATYDFGVAKVGYGYQTTKSNTGADTTTTLDHGINQKAAMYTVTAPVGAVTLLANLGSRTTNNNGGVAATQTALNGQKSTFTGLGAHYNFSKNTYAYYMYERANMADVDFTKVVINGAAVGAATTAEKSRNITAIGISTAF
jgi:general bacterial porin, GBP family